MTPEDNTTPREITLQERINEGWMKSAQTLPVDKQTKMDFWEAGYRAMLEESASLQSENDQLKKVIDQCEEALNGADRFIGKVGCGDDCLPKCIETALSTIQSLKLKGK